MSTVNQPCREPNIRSPQSSNNHLDVLVWCRGCSVFAACARPQVRKRGRTVLKMQGKYKPFRFRVTRSLAFGTWRNTFMGRTSRGVCTVAAKASCRGRSRAHTRSKMRNVWKLEQDTGDHASWHHASRAKDVVPTCAPHGHRWPAGAHSATYPGVTSHSLTRSPALIALRQMLIRRGAWAGAHARTPPTRSH